MAERYSTVLTAPTVMGSCPSLNLYQYLWTCLQVCGSKRLGCHADLYRVSRCQTRGESEDHTGKKGHKKGSTLALKPRAGTPRKDLCPPKNVLKSSATALKFIIRNLKTTDEIELQASNKSTPLFQVLLLALYDSLLTRHTHSMYLSNIPFSSRLIKCII